MRLASESFKAYDIRGIVPDQIDVEGAERVARAFAEETGAKEAVIGRDVRLTSEEFRDAVIDGLRKSGVDVIDIGQVSTDEFYFACGSKGLPGIMITASHNPKEYNGFKMVRKLPDLVVAKDFLKTVENVSEKDSDSPGKVTEESVSEPFLDHLLTLVPVSTIKPLKVVVDTSNGAQGAVWKRLAKRLPTEIIPLFWEADGNFPNHGNDIFQLENQRLLREKVKETGADLGLIFDPDGDRCLAVDDRGISVPGDWMAALLAVAHLKRTPGETILYDLRASDAVPDSIKAHGGKPFRWKPGHAYIKEQMRKRDIVFGGETSGHWYFKEFWFADCGILGALTMLQYVSGLDGPLSGKLTDFEAKYFLSGEINSTVSDREATVARVKEKYSDGIESELSGVAIRFPDWHCLVRPSDNEPLVRLTLEAGSRELMEEKRDELLALIRA